MVPYWKCSHTLGPRSASWVHLKLIKRTCQGAHDCVWIYTNYFRICQASAFGGVPGWDSKVTSIEENSTHINILVVGICQFQQRAWCCSEQRQTDRSTPAPGLEKKPSRFQGWRLHLLFPWPALVARDSHSCLKADLSSFWESCLRLRREQGRHEAINLRQGECFQRDRASKAVVPKMSSMEAGKAEESSASCVFR